MADRLEKVGDLWQGMDGQRCSLQGALATLPGILTGEDWEEALAASSRRPVSRNAARKTSRRDPV